MHEARDLAHPRQPTLRTRAKEQTGYQRAPLLELGGVGIPVHLACGHVECAEITNALVYTLNPSDINQQVRSVTHHK